MRWFGALVKCVVLVGFSWLAVALAFARGWNTVVAGLFVVPLIREPYREAQEFATFFIVLALAWHLVLTGLRGLAQPERVLTPLTGEPNQD